MTTMADDDRLSGNSAAPAQRGTGTVRTGAGDDVGPGTATSPASVRSSGVEGELTALEVVGDPPPPAVGEATEADAEVWSSAESGVEFAEATPEQLAAESSEESAVSDLRSLEGFEGFARSESSAPESWLPEAGEAANGQTAEFLPFLAALVPTLVSTVGPMIAKGIAGRLSPRATKAIAKLPPPAQGAGRVPPGSIGALLAQIAQLLTTMKGKPGSESSMEATDEALVSEAVAVLEAIVGDDNRLRIQATSGQPWRRICALRITFPYGSVRGTGFFIGARVLATAGHCVYMHDKGGWARKIQVIPGANGAATPYGSAESTQFRSVNGWVTGRRPESDYGCIVLPQNAFGTNLGSFGFSAMTPQALVAKEAVLAGYPGDKPFAELWGMAHKIKTVRPTTLEYDTDTYAGQSGAPVYINREGNRTVVGIHNYGSSTGNSATRVTPAVARRLSAWSKL